MALFTRDQAAAATTSADGNAYRYWAFLSYSHADTKDADRLHRFLERFRLPDSLVGNDHPLGTIPKRLTPIFRDRHELAASSSLGREIEEALIASRYLIVLCSPAAAKSRWVDQEIRDYKRLHGEDRVLAAIVAGEPFSEGEDECFPPALRHRVGRDGKLTKQKVEPVAADLREDRDGQRIGSLKIAAGMLEVGLDDLVQREQQRRHKRMTWIVAGSILGMAFTTGLSVVALNARDTARDERRQAEGLVGFLLGDLKDELEPIGRLDALDQVGARALAYYERQDKSDLTDDQLAQRSKALTLLGQIATQRGDTSGALARYREALRSTGELVDRSPNDPQRLFDHAQNVFYVGDVAQKRGDLAGAEQHFREYQLLADRMVSVDPDDPRWQMEVNYAAANVGIVELGRRQFPAAERNFARALSAIDGLVRRSPGNPEYRSAQVEALAWLADSRAAQGKLEQAAADRQRQLGMIEMLLQRRQGDVGLKRESIAAHQSLTLLFAGQGRLNEARDHSSRAVATAAELIAIEPTSANWQEFAAESLIHQANVALQSGRRAEAASAISQSCGISEALVRKDPTVSEWRALRRECHLGQARLASTASEKAILALRAVDAAKRVGGKDKTADRFALARAYRIFGEAKASEGRRSEAKAAWSQAAQIIGRQGNERPAELSERMKIARLIGDQATARSIRRILRQMNYND